MKNKRIRNAMLQAGINQTQLADILNVPYGEMSIMLKYELAVREQNEIMKRIREHDAQRKEIHHETDTV